MVLQLNALLFATLGLCVSGRQLTTVKGSPMVVTHTNKCSYKLQECLHCMNYYRGLAYHTQKHQSDLCAVLVNDGYLVIDGLFDLKKGGFFPGFIPVGFVGDDGEPDPVQEIANATAGGTLTQQATAGSLLGGDQATTEGEGSFAVETQGTDISGNGTVDISGNTVANAGAGSLGGFRGIFEPLDPLLTRLNPAEAAQTFDANISINGNEGAFDATGSQSASNGGIGASLNPVALKESVKSLKQGKKGQALGQFFSGLESVEPASVTGQAAGNVNLKSAAGSNTSSSGGLSGTSSGGGSGVAGSGASQDFDVRGTARIDKKN